MKKLRGSRGVTLTETLCTVLIVLLISAMLAVGVRFAVRTYPCPGAAVLRPEKWGLMECRITVKLGCI